MTLTATLTAASEDYLEAIFNILAEKQAVRPKDIAKRLNVGNSSVTGALHSLADKELINYAQYDAITLTPKGKAAAEDVIRRHEILRDFFVNVLAVEPAEADKAACQMEHSVTKIILERFVQLAEFFEISPRSRAEWREHFGDHCARRNQQKNGEKRGSSTLDEGGNSVKGVKKKMQNTTLKDLKTGNKAKVLKIHAVGVTARRIIEMGVSTGAVVEVERVAPLGDPIEIKVRGYHLSLRKEEAEGIEIECI